MMNLISKLLRKNTSPSRIAGFAIANFIGLFMVVGAVMFYFDSRGIFGDDDSVVNSDYLVINKKVTAANTFGDKESSHFSSDEISQMRSQPWVRRIGEFSSSDFRVYASVNAGGRGMETALFFESVPDDFVDVSGKGWQFHEGDNTVPIIIPKDYLALYNFGFAGSAGLPQLSEQIISGIPLDLYMRSEDGTRTLRMKGRIAGFSNRLNTVLVPESFMQYANSRLGAGSVTAPSRLIVDVSSPGDAAIQRFLSDNNMEVAGDKSGSSAAYLLRIVIAIVIAVGSVITILSLFVLMLSISLLMEKNRSAIHSLLMLGTPLRDVALPYCRMAIFGSLTAFILAIAALVALRVFYTSVLENFVDNPDGLIYSIAIGILLTAVIIMANILSIRHKVRLAWGLKTSNS